MSSARSFASSLFSGQPVHPMTLLQRHLLLFHRVHSNSNVSNMRLYEMSLESAIDYSRDVQCRCRYRFISVSLSYYFHGKRPFVIALLSPVYLLSVGFCHRIGNRSCRPHDDNEFPSTREPLRVHPHNSKLTIDSRIGAQLKAQCRYSWHLSPSLAVEWSHIGDIYSIEIQLNNPFVSPKLSEADTRCIPNNRHIRYMKWNCRDYTWGLKRRLRRLFLQDRRLPERRRRRIHWGKRNLCRWFNIWPGWGGGAVVMMFSNKRMSWQ